MNYDALKRLGDNTYAICSNAASVQILPPSVYHQNHESKSKQNPNTSHSKPKIPLQNSYDSKVKVAPGYSHSISSEEFTSQAHQPTEISQNYKLMSYDHKYEYFEREKSNSMQPHKQQGERFYPQPAEEQHRPQYGYAQQPLRPQLAQQQTTNKNGFHTTSKFEHLQRPQSQPLVQTSATENGYWQLQGSDISIKRKMKIFHKDIDVSSQQKYLPEQQNLLQATELGNQQYEPARHKSSSIFYKDDRQPFLPPQVISTFTPDSHECTSPHNLISMNTQPKKISTVVQVQNQSTKILSSSYAQSTSQHMPNTTMPLPDFYRPAARANHTAQLFSPTRHHLNDQLLSKKLPANTPVHEKFVTRPRTSYLTEPGSSVQNGSDNDYTFDTIFHGLLM